MSGLADWIWLALAAPLAGAVINGIFGRRLPRGAVFAVGLLAPGVSLAFAVLSFQYVRAHDFLAAPLFSWISTAGLDLTAGLMIDHLSAVMFLVVTGVGWLIHLYSVGYMGKDDGVARYFAYLNLFIFAMLILVLADSMALMFVGWEGVGLCSYLLIGFWFTDEDRARAGQKAFVVNRIGDLGFLLGMFLTWTVFGSLSFVDIVPGDRVVWPIAGLLFIGAMGKSAQIPLYVWLPDAMAGPTPVSALIHAATMVTAGVYMMCRMAPIYVASPRVTEAIALIAAATALLAGIIATAQHNLKKVLAYSTISQLAYMFAGAASLAFGAAMFHLVTHAFFKALLFLTAGAVIHALHNEEDMRKMGGLAKRLPIVAICFAVGSLAMAGPIGGFASKEEIVLATHGMQVVWAILLFTGFLTAFYIARAFFLTFFGPAHEHHDLHKPGLTILIPLVLLAAASAGCSMLGAPLYEWLGQPSEEHHDSLTMTISLVGMGAGYLLAFVTCLFAREGIRAWIGRSPVVRGVVHVVENKFYVDEIYHWTVVLPLQGLAAMLWLVVDRFLIDGVLVGGMPRGIAQVGLQVRRGATGSVNGIVAAILGGAVMVGAAWWLLGGRNG